MRPGRYRHAVLSVNSMKPWHFRLSHMFLRISLLTVRESIFFPMVQRCGKSPDGFWVRCIFLVIQLLLTLQFRMALIKTFYILKISAALRTTTVINCVSWNRSPTFWTNPVCWSEINLRGRWSSEVPKTVQSNERGVCEGNEAHKKYYANIQHCIVTIHDNSSYHDIAGFLVLIEHCDCRKKSH